jgi:hypothetical protein
MKAGARGISVLFASGDNGFGGAWAEPCQRNVATFPASCPYGTAVGGTMVQPKEGWDSPPGSTPFTARTAVPKFSSMVETSDATSAGGFSWYFDRPEYQREAVASYLTRAAAQKSAHSESMAQPHRPGHGSFESQMFNSAWSPLEPKLAKFNGFQGEHPGEPAAASFRHGGRGYPDVSAVSQGIVIACGGKAQQVSGTPPLLVLGTCTVTGAWLWLYRSAHHHGPWHAWAPPSSFVPMLAAGCCACALAVHAPAVHASARDRNRPGTEH